MAGELIRYMAHHSIWPGHIHIMVDCSGYRPLISQIYDSFSAHLDIDSVFAVKEELIGEFRRAPEGADTDLRLRLDLVLRAMNHTARSVPLLAAEPSVVRANFRVVSRKFITCGARLSSRACTVSAVPGL